MSVDPWRWLVGPQGSGSLLQRCYINQVVGMIRINDHSDSVITYYIRWYAVHSIPTFSIILISHDIEFLSRSYFLLKIMLATILTSISDGIMLYAVYCMLLPVHALIIKSQILSMVKCIWSLFAFHPYKLVQVKSAHSLFWQQW